MSNHSKIASSIDDAYFTPEESVKFCQSHLYVRDWVGFNKTILEPCVGSGQLVKKLPGVIFGADIHDYGWEGTVIQDYLTSPKQRVDLVFTNPPFGRMCSLAIKFFNKACQDSDRVAFIAPATFRKVSILDKLNLDFWNVLDQDLPDKNFQLPTGETRWVNTVFQMWERRSKPRKRIKDIVKYQHYFERVKPAEASYAFRTQGASAGRVLDGLDYSPASTAFLRGSEDRIRAHDWTTIASFTAGIPAIGLTDVAYGLHLEEQGYDITPYLKHGTNHPKN